MLYVGQSTHLSIAEVGLETHKKVGRRQSGREDRLQSIILRGRRISIFRVSYIVLCVDASTLLQQERADISLTISGCLNEGRPSLL